MKRIKALLLMLLVLLAVSAGSVHASEPPKAEASPDYYVGVCSSNGQLQFSNGVPKGEAHVWVTCPLAIPWTTHQVSMELWVESKGLWSGANWTEVGRWNTSCTLVPWPLRCDLRREFISPTNPSDRSKIYRMQARVTVDGSEGIPWCCAGTSEWVFNRNGLPYPKLTLDMGVMPFPTYVGPWSGGDPRGNPDHFRRTCDAYYEMMGWRPPSGSVHYHHLHPLAWGGRDVGTNCRILRASDHTSLVNAFWTGFLN